MKNNRPERESSLADLMSDGSDGTAQTPIQAPPSRSGGQSAASLVPVAGLGIRQTGILEHLDGSFTLDITIAPEEAAMLRSWAEQAGEPLEGYSRQTVKEALLAFCSSQAI